VVLATGGLVGGGLTWSSAGFGLAIEAPVMLAMGRQAATVSSGSPCGPLFESYAWSGTALATGMEQVGIWTAPDGTARNAEGELVSWIKCAGDAVAGAPRTLVQAIRSGLVAGRSASDSTLR
jgi:glycerol-3-phosphate dehydrogenase subunit B